MGRCFVERIIAEALEYFSSPAYNWDEMREAVEKFAEIVILEYQSLIQLLPDVCWCDDRNWSDEEMAAFFLLVCSQAGIDPDLMRSFAVLSYVAGGPGGVYKFDGISYPGCLNKMQVVAALCILRKDPDILKIIETENVEYWDGSD